MQKFAGTRFRFSHKRFRGSLAGPAAEPQALLPSRTIIEIVNRLTIVTVALGLSLTVLSGCKRDIQNTEAVRRGVLAYFSKRSDLLSMDVSVTNGIYRENEATATVHLQAKGSNVPGSGMDMRYLLERKGNDWVVKGRAGDDAHGQGMGGPPGAHPSDPGPRGGPGSMGAMPGTLPPGHPGGADSIGAMPQTLPPGHPAIPSKKPEPTR